VVPPVPWRRLAVAGVAAAGALALIGVFAIPRIESSKEVAEERERRELTQRQAAERRRLLIEQRPVRGRAPRTARGGLLAGVERAITAEARRRAAAGTLSGRILRTDCVPAPARRDVYDCVAVTSDIPGRGGGRGGVIGHPFRAVVDFERFTFAFCKTNPSAGEGAAPDPRQVVPLPRACRGS
jgi:hypothetical protein